MDAHDGGSGDLAERLRAAEDAIRARDEFLAIAAHELRSPLNALALRVAALELMAARRGEEELRAELERTRRSIDRYVRRAVVLLDVSHLNAGSQPLTREPVSVAAIVRNVVETHIDEARFHRTSIEWKVEGNPIGQWDPHMVEEIVGNLVSNAIKYGAGSPVRIAAVADEAGMANFEVSDKGPGIADAERAKIFDKFSRVVSTARDRAGFGLGLWIVGRMVAAHGGTIDVTAPAEGGSTFIVRLPLEPRPPAASKEAT